MRQWMKVLLVRDDTDINLSDQDKLPDPTSLGQQKEALR